MAGDVDAGAVTAGTAVTGDVVTGAVAAGAVTAGDPDTGVVFVVPVLPEDALGIGRVIDGAAFSSGARFDTGILEIEGVACVGRPAGFSAFGGLTGGTSMPGVRSVFSERGRLRFGEGIALGS